MKTCPRGLDYIDHGRVTPFVVGIGHLNVLLYENVPKEAYP